MQLGGGGKESYYGARPSKPVSEARASGTNGPIFCKGPFALTNGEYLHSRLPTLLGNASGILFREHSLGKENSMSYFGKLGELCAKLGEFTLAGK